MVRGDLVKIKNEKLSKGCEMQIISGRKYKPINAIVYGPPGVGKSTWAANAPKCLFIHAEEVDELNVDRLSQVKSWEELEAQLKWILETKPKYESLVLDSMDAFEKLLHKDILKKDPKCNGNLAKALGGYGAGYEYAANEMIRIRDTYIKEIRDQLGWNIIILSHSKKVTASDAVLGFTHDSYEMTLHQKTSNVWSDWVSAIFFASFITYKSEDDNSPKQFAIGAGERVMYTERRPSFTAKNRYDLPPTLPLEFGAFYTAFKAFYDGKEKSADELRQSIIGLMENVADVELKKKIEKSVEEAKNDVTKLKTIQKRMVELTGG
jgi:hypothetical protein